MVILFVLLGLLSGVAINALADSLPSYRRPEPPHCRSCGARRPASRWLAIGASLAGADRCEYCGTRIPMRHVIVEAAAALGAAGLVLKTPLPHGLWPSFLFFLIVLLILVIDIEHRLILFAVSVPAALLMLVQGVLDPALGWKRTLLGGAVGYAFFLLLYGMGILFARWVSHRRGQALDEVAFGFGDVMLAGIIGFAVGFPDVILALLQGILLAGAFSLAYILYRLARRSYSAFAPIPYGPFLIIAAMLTYLGGPSGLERLFLPR